MADRGTDRGRNAILAVLVVPIIGVVWWSGGGEAPAVPSGRLPEQFQKQILGAFADLNRVADPTKCSMSGNLGTRSVSCETSALATADLVRYFTERGWSVGASSVRDEVVLVRGEDRMGIFVFHDGRVSVSIRRLRP